MEQESQSTKKKRRSVNRIQSRVNLLCVVARMWADVKSKAKTLAQLSIKDYNQDNILGNVCIDDLQPYILQSECPTYSQMCQLRQQLSMKSASQSRQAKALSEFSETDLLKEVNRRKRASGQIDLFGNKF